MGDMAHPSCRAAPIEDTGSGRKRRSDPCQPEIVDRGPPPAGMLLRLREGSRVK
jgi:hypothetical protein